jgi:peptidoglycan/xylan/chitin deacetylase (PgdA/CDA1 family)
MSERNRWPRRRLIVNFHGVGPTPGDTPADERHYWCDTDTFVSLLDDIEPVSRAAGLPLQITFDDGNESDVRIAMPALVARGLTAEFFVCAGRLGQPGYLDERDVVELERAGMTVGSHGWSHVSWRGLDDAELDREVRQSNERLSDTLGRSVDTVAIPFGAYDRRVLAALRRHRVRVVYTSDPGRAAAGRWMVPRETVTASWTPGTLRTVATSAPALRERARRSAARVAKRLR